MVQNIYENIRNKLYNHSTPGKLKFKNYCTEPVVTVHLTEWDSPWSQHSSWSTRKAQCMALLLRRRETNGTSFPHSGFLFFLTTQEIASVFPDFQCYWGTCMLQVPGSSWEQKSSVTSGSTKGSVFLHVNTRGGREYLVLMRQPTNLSDGEIIHASLEKMHSHERFVRHSNSVAGADE